MNIDNLILAIKNNNYEVIQQALSQGFDTNYKRNGKLTLLEYSLNYHRVEIVKILIDFNLEKIFESDCIWHTVHHFIVNYNFVKKNHSNETEVNIKQIIRLLCENGFSTETPKFSEKAYKRFTILLDSGIIFNYKFIGLEYFINKLLDDYSFDGRRDTLLSIVQLRETLFGY
jgi:hypothetical protein